MAKRDEGVGDKARLRRIRIVFGVAVGDAAEILEGLEIVLRDAVALGIHAAEFPLRDGVAFLGGVFQRVHALGGLAGLEPVGAGAERLGRRHRGGRRRHHIVGLGPVERKGRRGHEANACKSGAQHNCAQQGISCPHNTLSQPPRRDA